MKLRKQIIVPIVAVSALSAAVVPVVMATVNKPKQPEVRTDLFNIKNGVLNGFKQDVTQAQINEYTKDGVLRLPACKTIGANAFRGIDLPFAESIVISNDTTQIAPYAFYGCSKVAKVTFEGGESPESLLTTIGDSAFAHCSSLTGFPFPKGVTTIGKSAFMGCSSFRDFDFSAFSTKEGKLDSRNKDKINNIVIGNSAFVGLFPLGTIDNPIKLIVGDFDEESLHCTEGQYGAKFVLSQFASKLQLKTDASIAKLTNWIVGETTKEIAFDVCTVVPEEYLLVESNVLTGITEEGKTMLQFIGYTALQIPDEVTEIDASFWADVESTSLKESITDLDLLDCNITSIPEEFMYNAKTGERYLSNLENVRLNVETTVIDHRAFFAGSESDPSIKNSTLKWVNLNALKSLTRIGEDAFAGNSELCSFGENPCEKGQEADEQLIIDEASNLEAIGARAFEGTGIYNIVFKNLNSEQTKQITFEVDDNSKGFYFAALENLSSIVFDNFIFGATYDKATSTITFGDEDPISTFAQGLFINASGENKQPFAGSFNSEVSKQFIQVPGWSPDAGIEEDFPCTDYFKEITKSGVIIDGKGAMKKSFYEYIIGGISPEEEVKFASWELRAPEIEQIEFNPSFSKDDISQIDAGKPQEGQEFSFTTHFVNSPTTIDRDNTEIVIEEANGNKTKLLYWTLTTSGDGTTATVTIPAEYVTGNINAELVVKSRGVTPSSGIEPKWDGGFNNVKIKQTNIFEGQDIDLVAEAMNESVELSGTNSSIKIDGTLVPYGKRDFGWTYEKSGIDYQIRIPGWHNLWTSAPATIEIDIQQPTKTYDLSLACTQEHFVKGKEPTLPSETIDSRTTPSLDVSAAELNAGYGYKECRFEIYDTNKPSDQPLWYTKLELADGRFTSKDKISTIPLDTAAARYVIVTALVHNITYTADPGITFIEEPTTLFEDDGVHIQISISEDSALDLTKCTMQSGTGAVTSFEALQASQFIAVKQESEKEGKKIINIDINEAGWETLTHADLAIVLALAA